jgi:hypothetical protein
MEIIYKNRKGKLFTIIFDKEYSHLILSQKWRVMEQGSSAYAYTDIMVNGVKVLTISMHRLIMGVKNSKSLIDHINHNGLDNRIINLRICNTSQNMMNKKPRGNSKFIGVHYEKNKKKYVAYITVDRTRKKIGMFECEYCAAMARDVEAKKLHGDFANLNFK